MNMGYQDIITRLEAASGPDRELDAAIWVAANPDDYIVDDVSFNDKGGVKLWLVGRHDPFWTITDRYTASLDAAIALVERKLPGWEWAVGFDGNVYGGGLVCQPNHDFVGYHKTSASICLLIALFKALQAQEKDK